MVMSDALQAIFHTLNGRMIPKFKEYILFKEGRAALHPLIMYRVLGPKL